MKVSVCYFVLNEEQFLAHSLRSIYAFADQIIVVEGAIELFWSCANPDGSSTDRTVGIIEGFPDPKEKIKLIQGKWRDKFEMQNKYLQHATGDWVLVCAGDEAYRPEELEKLRLFALKHPYAVNIKFPFVHFIWDERHVITCTRPMPNLRDWTSRHQRFFKNMKGLRYATSHSDVEDRNGRLLIFYPPSTQLWFPEVHVYHYGYCKPAEEIRRKLEFYCERDKAHIKHGFKTPEEYIAAHPYFSKKGDPRTGEVILPNDALLGVIPEW